MSEPVTQAEIEDVLSSIRRLVSEDARDARLHDVEDAPAAVSHESTAVEPPVKAATRLVLTPALRVADPTSALDGELDASEQSRSDIDMEIPQSGPSAETTAPLFHGMDVGDESSGEGAQQPVIPNTADAAEPADEDAPWKDPWATLYQAAGVADPSSVTRGSAGATDAERADFEEADGLDGPIASSDRVFAVVQKITELEAKVARSQEQWEPDGRSSDPYAGTNIETLQWRDDCEDPSPEQNEGSAAAGGDVFEEVVFHHQKSVEATSQLHDGDAEDDPDFAPDFAREIAEDAIASEALDSLGNEDAYIDEESLRELVADIVREELQGALGERITRNVRKLVRREIHRALASQDLL